MILLLDSVRQRDELVRPTVRRLDELAGQHPSVGTVKNPVSMHAARMSSRICLLVSCAASRPLLAAATRGETSTSGSCCSATLDAVITRGDEKLRAPSARRDADRRRAVHMANAKLTVITASTSTWCAVHKYTVYRHLYILSSIITGTPEQ